MQLSPAGTAYLGVVGILFPWSAIKALRQEGTRPPVDRSRYYRGVVIQQWVIGAMALLVARVDGIPLRAGRMDAAALVVTAAATAVLVLLMRPVWRRTVARQEPRVARLPRTPGDIRWWVAVSLSAGICEEIVWRGVLQGELWWLFDDWWIAAAIAATLFGLAHAIQGWHRTLIIGGIAIGMHLLVRWCDGLAMAMLCHASYDAIAGFTYAKLIREKESRE